jgi:ribonuclease-3
MYIDGGLKPAQAFIDRTIAPKMSLDMAKEPENPKSALQERLQEDGITPTYKLVETQGPPHDRTFVAQVFAGEQGLAQGTGRTKKEAESQAAKSTLARLGEFFGIGLDEAARAEKAEAARQAKVARVEAARLAKEVKAEAARRAKEAKQAEKLRRKNERMQLGSGN